MFHFDSHFKAYLFKKKTKTTKLKLLAQNKSKWAWTKSVFDLITKKNICVFETENKVLLFFPFFLIRNCFSYSTCIYITLYTLLIYEYMIFAALYSSHHLNIIIIIIKSSLKILLLLLYFFRKLLIIYACTYLFA